MNRMALFCSVAVAALTLAAFVNHVQTSELPGGAPPQMPPQIPPQVPSLAGAAPGGGVPTQLPEPPPDATVRAAIRAQVLRDVVAPIQASFERRGSFSRVRRTPTTVHLEMPEPTEERAPREGGSEFVLFELESEGGRVLRSGERRTLAFGRVEVASGHVELSIVRTPKATADVRLWQPLDEALAQLGVKRGKRAR